MISKSSAEGVGVLREAAALLGLEVRSSDGLLLANPAGGEIGVEVRQLSLAAADGLRRRLQEWEAGRTSENVLYVLVADRVTKDAREVLRDAGWGWLDLRGHLHLQAPGLFVDADLPTFDAPVGRPSALSGRAGLEVAATMLLDPDRPLAVRAVAGQLGRAPSTVSEIVARLREAGLVDAGNRPVVPELFWELADAWPPVQVDVHTMPVPGDGAATAALQLGLDPTRDPVGWALTDTVAAAHYGAPVVAPTTYPRDFYVPDRAVQRRAVHLLGVAPDHAGRAATVRVAPVPMACTERAEGADEWPLTRPLFVALDLAQDRDRGHEILAGWTPPEPWHRVW